MIRNLYAEWSSVKTQLDEYLADEYLIKVMWADLSERSDGENEHVGAWQKLDMLWKHLQTFSPGPQGNCLARKTSHKPCTGKPQHRPMSREKCFPIWLVEGEEAGETAVFGLTEKANEPTGDKPKGDEPSGNKHPIAQFHWKKKCQHFVARYFCCFYLSQWPVSSSIFFVRELVTTTF